MACQFGLNLCNGALAEILQVWEPFAHHGSHEESLVCGALARNRSVGHAIVAASKYMTQFLRKPLAFEFTEVRDSVTYMSENSLFMQLGNSFTALQDINKTRRLTRCQRHTHCPDFGFAQCASKVAAGSHEKDATQRYPRGSLNESGKSSRILHENLLETGEQIASRLKGGIEAKLASPLRRQDVQVQRSNVKAKVALV